MNHAASVVPQRSVVLLTDLAVALTLNQNDARISEIRLAHWESRCAIRAVFRRTSIDWYCVNDPLIYSREFLVHKKTF